jgi:hypothetical protein
MGFARGWANLSKIPSRHLHNPSVDPLEKPETPVSEDDMLFPYGETPYFFGGLALLG